MDPEEHSLDIVSFLVLLPLGVELVNLAGYISLVLQVKRLQERSQAYQQCNIRMPSSPSPLLLPLPPFPPLLYLKHLTEPTPANEVEEEVARMKRWMGLKPKRVFCLNALQLSNVKVSLTL